MAEPIISGIYRIRNTVNGKMYVGSAVNLKLRWFHHRKWLRKGNHHSIALQNAWKKHGETAFVFEVIEYVPDIANLIAREQHWIDTHKTATRTGYNICPTAGSTLGVKFSDEALARIRAFRNLPEQRAANSARQLGRKPSPETKAKWAATIASPESKAKRRAAQLGRKATQAAIEANRKGQTGRKHSQATKEKMRLASIGRRHSEETKALVSRLKKGKRLRQRSPEEKAALRIKLGKLRLGRKHSEAAKAKMSTTKKGKPRNWVTETRADFKARISKTWTGRKHTAASKERMREVKLGKRPTEETRTKMRSAAARNNTSERLAILEAGRRMRNNTTINDARQTTLRF